MPGPGPHGLVQAGIRWDELPALYAAMASPVNNFPLSFSVNMLSISDESIARKASFSALPSGATHLLNRGHRRPAGACGG